MKILVYVEHQNPKLRLHQIPADREPDAVVTSVRNLPEPGMTDEFQGRRVNVLRLEVDIGNDHEKPGLALLIIETPINKIPPQTPEQGTFM